MDKIDYTEVDAAIVSDLKDRPRRGYLDFNAGRAEARKVAGRGDLDRVMDRVMDRRLQALRKRGLIHYANGHWHVTAGAQA